MCRGFRQEDKKDARKGPTVETVYKIMMRAGIMPTCTETGKRRAGYIEFLNLFHGNTKL